MYNCTECSKKHPAPANRNCPHARDKVPGKRVTHSGTKEKEKPKEAGKQGQGKDKTPVTTVKLKAERHPGHYLLFFINISYLSP